MALTVQQQVAALATLTVAQLRARYREVFGEDTHAGNKDWLRKRIAWRIQALAEGGLSERAQRRADELANDADLRVCIPAGHPLLALVSEPAGEPVVAGSTPASTGPAGPRLHRPQVATEPVAVPQPKDDRLPPVGTVLTRAYKGKTLKVTVLADGFEYAGEKYPSLSAVARALTGSHCNGFAFFHLSRTAKESK